MSGVHDPARHESYLVQALLQDKNGIGFFLGAGCPVSVKIADATGGQTPLIPDVAGLTASATRTLASSSSTGPLLAAVQNQLATDGIPSPTIEDLLTHIRALRQVAGKDAIRGLSATQLDALDAAICEAIVGDVSRELPAPPTPFHRMAQWIAGSSRREPVEIFTTNYDLLVEQALEAAEVPYFDGFVGSHRAFFDIHAIEEDTFPSRWARVWKLHGSVNWWHSGAGSVLRTSGFQPTGERRLIHPSHLKYVESRRMPYIAMLDRLKAFLKRSSSVLLICGYSFGDEHLNEVLFRGLKSNPSAMAFALIYSPLSKHTRARALAAQVSNLSVLARDGAVVAKKESIWGNRETTAADEQSLIVRWEQIPGSDERRPAFVGGDFANLGALLESLRGHS